MGRLRDLIPHVHGHGPGDSEQHAWRHRGLARVDARFKMLVLAVLLVVNLVVSPAVSALVLLAVLVALLGVQRVRPLVLAVRLAPAVFVAALLVLLRAFTEPGRELAGFGLPVFGQVSVTLEGLAVGGASGLVVVTGVALVLSLGLTTPLPSLLSALRWFRVPELLIELGMLMYRYLFLFAEEAGRMRQAQHLRGPRTSWRRAMGGFSALGATLLIRSYERSQRVYDAQRLRGAEGGKHR